MTTLAEIRQQVIDDLDLDEQDFISEEDLTRWTNDAIQVAEGEIHTLYEDYFLASEDISITYGSSQYVDYPADIYANKIRKVIFTDGTGTSSSTHEVRRVRDILKAEEDDIYNTQTSTPVLQWSPYNGAADGRKIRLYPSTGRTGTLIIYYIRNAKRLVEAADETDIDEFSRFLVQYVKTQAYLKDGDKRAEDSKALEEQYKSEMILTLSDMVPDDNNEVMMDLSHYNEMVGGNNGDF